MKIAATVLVLIVAFVFADGMFSSTSINQTVGSDFLSLDTPNAAPAPTKFEDAADEEEVIEEGWIETIRRRRLRRQSRFC